MSKPWTHSEVKFLVKNYSSLEIDDLKNKLNGRSKSQIYSKAHTLGLRKKTKLRPIKLPKENNLLNPPSLLNEHGRKFWDQYTKLITDIDFAMHVRLTDLCYWEQRKIEAIENLEKGRDVVVYRNKDGSIKHVQTSAFFTNLKSIQSEINTLREKIFKTQGEIPKKEEKPKPVKKSFTGWRG
jgi:hypothetical protein